MLLAVAAAGLIQSAAGFGSALVCMPILTLLLGIRNSSPLVALLGMVVSTVVLAQNWRGLDWREAGRLILASLLGIPLGIWLLRTVDEGLVTGALGLVLIAYALHALWANGRAEAPPAGNTKASIAPHPWLWTAGAYLAGFTAGILGGAYNTNGPPVIIYGAAKRWPKVRFKSILQSFFLADGVLVVFGHAMAGSLTPETWRNFLYALPALGVGILLGSRLDKRLDPDRFRRIVLILILLLGISLLVL